MEILLLIVQCVLMFLAICTWAGGATVGGLVYGTAAVTSYWLNSWWPVAIFIVVMIIFSKLGIGVPQKITRR